MRPHTRPIVAAALLAIYLMTASSAQAALVVTSATRSISADTSRSAVDAANSAATAGTFNDSVLSAEPVNNGAQAAASQDSTLGAFAFSGLGEASLSLANNASGVAESLISVFFTLTTHFSFAGTTDLSGSGNAPSHATFDLDDLNAGSIVSASDTQPLLAFAGNLDPGNYRLVLRASSGSIDPNESGLANFAFNLNFVDLDIPPAAVPEPHGLALALAGFMASGAVQRRKRLNSSPQAA